MPSVILLHLSGSFPNPSCWQEEINIFTMLESNPASWWSKRVPISLLLKCHKYRSLFSSTLHRFYRTHWQSSRCKCCRRHLSQLPEKSSQHSEGIEPTTILIRGVHSSAELQPLPETRTVYKSQHHANKCSGTPRNEPRTSGGEVQMLPLWYVVPPPWGIYICKALPKSVTWRLLLLETVPGLYIHHLENKISNFSIYS